MDTILGILWVKGYNGIHALADLSVNIRNTNNNSDYSKID
jgi:hypothetical protein